LFKKKMNAAERKKAARTFREWVENGYPVLSATEPA
jgi:hypothetical protein